MESNDLINISISLYFGCHTPVIHPRRAFMTTNVSSELLYFGNLQLLIYYGPNKNVVSVVRGGYCPWKITPLKCVLVADNNEKTRPCLRVY